MPLAVRARAAAHHRRELAREQERVVVAELQRDLDDRPGKDYAGRVFVTPFTMITSLDPSNPTSADAATTLSDHDRLQARRVRELAARYKTRIHTDAFAGMVRLAAKDLDKDNDRAVAAVVRDFNDRRATHARATRATSSAIPSAATLYSASSARK